MSQTMNKKTRKSQLPVVEEHDLTAAEKLVEKLSPYGSMIALGIALLFLAFIAIAYFIKAGYIAKEREWQQLNASITEVGISGNTNSLKRVAEEYPESKAGLWALQLAGDYDLRTGLSQMTYDREGGMQLINKATESLQKVVDAPADIKSPMLQRRSTFSLAYALESVGEFGKANELYKQLVESAPDAAFAEPARRGVERTSDETYAALFEKFQKWEDILGDAPGPMIPERPDISFPSLGETTGGGGDFGSGGDNQTPSETQTSAPGADGGLPTEGGETTSDKSTEDNSSAENNSSGGESTGDNSSSEDSGDDSDNGN